MEGKTKSTVMIRYRITRKGAKLLRLKRGTEIVMMAGNRPAPGLWKQVGEPFNPPTDVKIPTRY